MGVLSCGRAGCPNIMCDRFSTQYGYLCDDCFEELVRRGVRTNIKEFMSNERDEADDLAASEAYFDQIFRPNNGDGYDD